MVSSVDGRRDESMFWMRGSLRLMPKQRRAVDVAVVLRGKVYRSIIFLGVVSGGTDGM